MVWKAIDALRNRRVWCHQINDAGGYFKLVGEKPSLSKKELPQIRKRWESLGWLGGGRRSWHKHVSGKFDPRYVPSESYGIQLLLRFNNKKLMRAWSDKACFERLMPDASAAQVVPLYRWLVLCQ